MSRAGRLLPLLLAAGACGTPRTEVVVGIATDLVVPDELTGVRIIVARDGVPGEPLDRPLDGAPYFLPGTLVLDGDDRAVVEVEAIGLLRGVEQVRRRARLTLVPGRTLFVRLALARACVPTSCPSDQTCIEGLCGPLDVDADAPPPFQPGMEASPACYSGTDLRDSAGQPSAVLGDGRCRDGEVCREATCYLRAPSSPAVGLTPPLAFSPGATALAAAVADFDGDGRPDVTTIGNSEQQVLLSDGAGGFRVVEGPVAGGTAIAAADFDRDGHPDIAVAKVVGVSLWTGDGSGGFRFKQLAKVGTWLSTIAVGDFDGDGEADVAVADNEVWNAYVLRGNGDGTLGAPVMYPCAEQPYRAAAGDFDGDGRADLVLSHPKQNVVTLRRANPDGTLGAAVRHPVGLNPIDVAVLDADGDRHLDLAVTGSEVLVLRGDGAGGFTPVSYASVGQTAAIAVGDFDGDGHPDLALDQYRGPMVEATTTLLLGVGDGSFRAGAAYRRPSGAMALAAADFDGDGRSDVAAAHVLIDHGVELRRGASR